MPSQGTDDLRFIPIRQPQEPLWTTEHAKLDVLSALQRQQT